MTTEHVAASINAWDVAQSQFDLAAERLGMDVGMRRVLREPRPSIPAAGSAKRRLYTETQR